MLLKLTAILAAGSILTYLLKTWPKPRILKETDNSELAALRKQILTAQIVRPEAVPKNWITEPAQVQALREPQEGGLRRFHLARALDVMILEKAEEMIVQRAKLAEFFKSTKTKKKGKNGKLKKGK